MLNIQDDHYDLVKMPFTLFRRSSHVHHLANCCKAHSPNLPKRDSLALQVRGNVGQHSKNPRRQPIVPFNLALQHFRHSMETRRQSSKRHRARERRSNLPGRNEVDLLEQRWKRDNRPPPPPPLEEMSIHRQSRHEHQNRPKLLKEDLLVVI